jgi:hypothetical protein
MPRYYKQVRFQPEANVPMVGETRDRLALEIRMAGETLIERPSIDSYNILAKMFAALNRAGMAAVLVDPGSKIMAAICDRYEQTGTITMEPEEAAGLRQAVADIDAGLHRIPLQRFAKAVAEVEVFCAAVDPTDKGQGS